MSVDQILDAGAQAERTALAWQRTAIGLVVNGVLLVRWSLVEHIPAWPAVVVTATASLALLAVVPTRYRRIVEAVRSGRNPLSRLTVLATVLGLAAVCGLFGAQLWMLGT